MPNEEFLTNDEKQKIRENNRIIEQNNETRTERVEEIADGLKNTINKLRPPSIIAIANKSMKALTGKKITRLIANDGIGTMFKRTRARKTAKQAGLNLFRRRQ